MCMYPKAIAITNRHLCERDFLVQVERMAKADVGAVILREKDLTEAEYRDLASQVKEVLKPYETTLILHTQVKVARQLNQRKIHLPMDMLRREDVSDFDLVGASTHSVEEAIEAEKLGANYVTASHIYPTDCKKGVEPRGLHFLEEVVSAVHIPVYALGGITKERINAVLATGASGYCMMSYFATL